MQAQHRMLHMQLLVHFAQNYCCSRVGLLLLRVALAPMYRFAILPCSKSQSFSELSRDAVRTYFPLGENRPKTTGGCVSSISVFTHLPAGQELSVTAVDTIAALLFHGSEKQGLRFKALDNITGTMIHKSEAQASA